MKKELSGFNFYNPLEDLFLAGKELKKDLNVYLQFSPNLKEEEGCFGRTLFPDDGGYPQILIDASLPFEHVTEIFAHELAHAIAGRGHNHDEVWEKTFDSLFTKYSEIAPNRSKLFAQSIESNSSFLVEV
jgi:hypothetical protein